jgi:iron complex outermembrane receptor protein
VDPARGNQSYQTTSIGRSNPNLKPESSTNEFYGAVFEPSFAPGLSLSANYYLTVQKDAIQGSLGSVTILNNESIFPGFVERAAPTAADTAAGWKGVITTIYSQRVNFGEIRNESMDLGADYRLPWERFGRWRLSVNAAKTIAQSRQLTFGAAPINDVGDTFASPRWNIATGLYWKQGSWSANVAHSYMSGYNSNQAGVTPSVYTTPAMRMIDLRGTYEFKNGIWQKYGKGLRIGFGIANLEDTKPPFFNNIFGFNGGLHGRWAFGRTYEFSFTLPLDARSGSPSVNR